MSIAPVDLALLIVYLGGTLAFGLWIGRGQRDAQDYLLGGRDLPWWALLLSIVATETSTATFLSVPGIAYAGDLRYLQLPLGYIVGRAIAAFALLPLYFQGRLFTAYEVLRARSGAAARTLASGLFLVTRTLADGLRLYLAALVLQAMLGWSLPAAVAAIGGATVVYTVFGGIRAVVWTDVLQFAVYMLGALAALFVLAADLPGGVPGALADASAHGRLRAFDFGLDFADPYTFWAGLVGGAVLSLGSHGVDQIIVQRYLSARRLRDAQKALFWSGPVVLAQFALFLVLGLCLSFFYAGRPAGPPPPRGDQVFADFIVHHLPPGLVGLVLGAVFAAAMSTLSSSLSASASALVNDFVLPLAGRPPGERFALRAARAATVLFAVLQAGVGTSGLGGQEAVVNQVLGIATLTTGVILGLFLLALRPGRPAASLVGLCGGLATMLAIVFVLPCELPFGKPPLRLLFAWPWWGVLTSGATFLCGALARTLLRASP